MTTIRVPYFIIALCFSSITMHGAIISSTDFDSAVAGPTTAPALDSVTTGASWTLNGTRGATYALAGSMSDLALLMDDTSTGPANGGAIIFAELTLDIPASFAIPGSAAIYDFKTATRRTGSNKGLRYAFVTDAGEIQLDWYNSGGLFLDGNAIGSTPFTFLDTWSPSDPAVKNVTLSFSGTQISYSVGSENGTIPLLNGATQLTGLRILSLASSQDNRGVWLADLQVATVPEAGTLWLTIACAMSIIGIRAAQNRRSASSV